MAEPGHPGLKCRVKFSPAAFGLCIFILLGTTLTSVCHQILTNSDLIKDGHVQLHTGDVVFPILTPQNVPHLTVVLKNVTDDLLVSKSDLLFPQNSSFDGLISKPGKRGELHQQRGLAGQHASSGERNEGKRDTGNYGETSPLRQLLLDNKKIQQIHLSIVPKTNDDHDDSAGSWGANRKIAKIDGVKKCKKEDETKRKRKSSKSKFHQESRSVGGGSQLSPHDRDAQQRGKQRESIHTGETSTFDIQKRKDRGLEGIRTWASNGEVESHDLNSNSREDATLHLSNEKKGEEKEDGAKKKINDLFVYSPSKVQWGMGVGDLESEAPALDRSRISGQRDKKLNKISQVEGKTQRERRDIQLEEKEASISDRVDPFPVGPLSRITLIHPGRGGILPVFSPELRPEESQESISKRRPDHHMFNQPHQSDEQRKQDLFMTFQPVVFHHVVPSSPVRFNPEIEHQRPNQHRQPPRMNHHHHHHQGRLKFPNSGTFRHPHDQQNSHRPPFAHEFEPRPTKPPGMFFPGPSGFNRFNQSSHNMGFNGGHNRPFNQQGRFPPRQPPQVSGPWSFEEERPTKPHGPPEELDIRPPEPLHHPPGSIVFEPPTHIQHKPTRPMEEFEPNRPIFQEPNFEKPRQHENHHESRRPEHHENNFHHRPMETPTQRPWNSVVEMFENNNPQHGNFHKKPVSPSHNRFPTTPMFQSHNPTLTTPPRTFNHMGEQEIITRLPLNRPSQHHFRPTPHPFNPEESTNTHARPVTPSLDITTRPHQNANVNQFFIPSNDDSRLPFDFPSSFANNNNNNNNQETMWVSIPPPSRPDEPTTPRPHHSLQPIPVHVTERPEGSRPPLVTPVFRPTERPHQSFSPTQSHRDEEVSRFTPSFVPTPSTVPSINDEFHDDSRDDDDDNFSEGITVQPDPAIIPPKPPFLPQFHGPLYIIPPLKMNRTTQTPPPTTMNIQVTSPGISFPSQHFIPSTSNHGFNLKPITDVSRPTNQFTTDDGDNHKTTDPFTGGTGSTPSNRPFDFVENTADLTETSFDGMDFQRTTPTGHTTVTGGSTSTITTNSHGPPSTTSTNPTNGFRSTEGVTEFSTQQTGLPIPKFLTPLVKFRGQPVTDQSFVPNSAVKITPMAVATPEFAIGSLRPSSQPPNSLSTPTKTPHNLFNGDQKVDDEFDALVTPGIPRPNNGNINLDFPRTSTVRPTTNTFFPSSTIPDDNFQTLDDNFPNTQDDFKISHDDNRNIENQGNTDQFHGHTISVTSSPFPENGLTNVMSSTGLSSEPFSPNHFTLSTGDTNNNKFPASFHHHSTKRPSPRPSPRPRPRPSVPFRPVLTDNRDKDVVNQFHRPDDEEIVPSIDVNIPQVGSPAKSCNADACQLPNCFCGGNNRIPGDLSANEVPQLVLLTFDDDVNEVNWNIYKKILYTGRQNPNGCPIQSTFYISHEWTDYSKVQNLYADGHEIASHSISHPDGAQYTKQKWKDEILGQKEILSYMGGVNFDDIRGMRAPFLAVGGNKMFGMLYDTNFTYDSSLPVPIHDPPFWPYTLDYSMGHDCMIPPCPRQSFPGVWEIPMVMWVDLKGGRCSMADACQWPDTKEQVYQTLMKNFQRHYRSNRAPFNLFYHSAWFDKPHNMDGFLLFMDKILTLPDVYFVTSTQALEWVRQPTPLREIHTFVPFSCHLRTFRIPKCKKPHECQLKFRGETRYVRTCQECPDIYPWIKNPFGKST